MAIDSAILQSKLKQFFGFDAFKGDQERIIRHLVDGGNAFVLMPTGGGKSLCYQLPALVMEGTAIVISPLIALMKNQVDAIRGFVESGDGIAHFLNSSLSRTQVAEVREDLLSGVTKLLYVAPESLTKEENIALLKEIHISFYAVDEAHCISEWGHDFRPEYRKIRSIIEDIQPAPVIALTATATPKVQSDILKNLRITDATVFKSSFNRPNLYYEVRDKVDTEKDIIRFIRQNPGKSGIIYCLSRKKVEELAQLLSINGIQALPYHAGLDAKTRAENQDRFLMEDIQVIVATIAFGMGIDKPDVRLVIHIDCPDSIEAYFQEAGRAGRDGRRSYAVLLYNGADKRKLEKRITDTFPSKDYIRQVYEHLAFFYQIGVGSGYNHTFEFNIEKFCHAFRHFPIQVDSALKILTRAGYIEYTEEQDNQARLMFTVNRGELYKLENNTPDEERIITTLLRNYGGLFSDYHYIDEGFLASQTALQPHQVYQILKGLSQRHILHFIPQKKTPYIRYTQRREDKELLQFPPAIYEERLSQFRQRIAAVIRYATDDRICRSRQLLSYFGETENHDCGLCDVCLSHRREGLVSEPRMNTAMEKILHLLSDGQPHPITDLRGLQLPVGELDTALSYLLQEEYIRQEDGLLSKN